MIILKSKSKLIQNLKCLLTNKKIANKIFSKTDEWSIICGTNLPCHNKKIRFCSHQYRTDFYWLHCRVQFIVLIFELL